ncbi:uncharacterized protein LOC112494536 [Cephus cinctus]|uniref:Uncharacterized protein LOC112494536 n=1 Tax=Cephus cinctus TaxID=211228 RepID=A0AAJ7RJE4_CEPCN|nr:uncharacterized protein LOC112494536 [Cephus cinctus]
MRATRARKNSEKTKRSAESTRHFRACFFVLITAPVVASETHKNIVIGLVPVAIASAMANVPSRATTINTRVACTKTKLRLEFQTCIISVPKSAKINEAWIGRANKIPEYLNLLAVDLTKPDACFC